MLKVGPLFISVSPGEVNQLPDVAPGAASDLACLRLRAGLTASRHDYRAEPLSTKSISRSPQIEQRRTRAQSGTGIVAPDAALHTAGIFGCDRPSRSRLIP